MRKKDEDGDQIRSFYISALKRYVIFISYFFLQIHRSSSILESYYIVLFSSRASSKINSIERFPPLIRLNLEYKYPCPGANTDT